MTPPRRLVVVLLEVEGAAVAAGIDVLEATGAAVAVGTDLLVTAGADTALVSTLALPVAGAAMIGLSVGAVVALL